MRGKSDKMLDRLACHEDHPPPMRGKEVVHDQKDLHGGITPPMRGKRVLFRPLAP